MTAEIYTLYMFPFGLFLQPDVMDSQFRVRISSEREYDQSLEDRINATWDENAKKNPNAQDNVVSFFTGKPITLSSNGGLEMELTKGKFRDVIFFNRRAENFDEVKELAANGNYSPTHVSTHYHVLTNDGKIVFAKKTNQFDQMSGFGGFPNLAKYGVEIDGVVYLDTYRLISENAQKEMGKSIADKIVSIQAVGATYVSRPGLSGSDMNYLVQVDMSAEELIQSFESSDQFSDKKGLVAVDFTPESMAEFVQTTFESGNQVSPYAMGCQAILMQMFYGSRSQIYINAINMYTKGYSSSAPDFFGLNYNAANDNYAPPGNSDNKAA